MPLPLESRVRGITPEGFLPLDIPLPAAFFVLGEDGMPLFTHSLPQAIGEVATIKDFAQVVLGRPHRQEGLTPQGSEFLYAMQALDIPIIPHEEARTNGTLEVVDNQQTHSIFVVGLTQSDPEARYFVSYNMRSPHQPIVFLGSKGVAPLRDEIASYYGRYLLPDTTQLAYPPTIDSDAVHAIVGAFALQGITVSIRSPKESHNQ